MRRGRCFACIPPCRRVQGCLWARVFLIPKALMVPGWHHLSDNILRSTLNGVAFFPSFLSALKALASFLRIDAYRQILRAQVQHDSDVDMACIGTVPPSFADWRWGTLHNVLRWMLRAKTCLQVAWEEARDTVMSENFWFQAIVVQDVARASDSLRVWGAGCNCHREERQQGQKVDCLYTGRLLPHLHRRMDEFFEVCRLELQAPQGDDYCLGVELPFGIAHARRALWERCLTMAKETMAWARHLPFALAATRSDPALMKALRDEYNSTPAPARHRITHQFFAYDGRLRTEVDEHILGQGVGEALSAELWALELLIMSEQAVEAPHATMQHEKRRARRNTRPWHSATKRPVVSLRNAVGREKKSL